MADTKLTALTEYDALLAVSDVLYMVDVSASNAHFKVKAQRFLRTDGADTQSTGGGTLALGGGTFSLGGYTFTVPATGTPVMRAGAQTVTHTLTGGTINTATLGTPTVSGGTFTAGTVNTAKMGTPTITGGTINTVAMGTPTITGGTFTSGTVNTAIMGTPTVEGYLKLDHNAPASGTVAGYCYLFWSDDPSHGTKALVVRFDDGTQYSLDKTAV